jgi:CHAT domain-containing protein/tetratricopeptide (TPR) repeat protein
LFAVLSAGLPACHSSKTEDPAAVYRSIRNDFLHGALAAARARARQASLDSAHAGATGAEWSMRYRLLEADILANQGRHAEVITLLSARGDSYPLAGDAAIKRNLLLGLAHYVLGQSQRSVQELDAARNLAVAANSALLGEVLQTQAVVQLYRDQLPEAMDLFKRSLAFARAHGDAYLEATDLLNIGFATSQLEQYDAAIVLLNEAAKFAAVVEARTVMQAALGNSGEAYLHLGDFDRALAGYQQAERLAEEIGATSSEIEWLQAIGLSYYKLGNLDQARLYDERALAAAQALEDFGDIATIDANLAFLLLRQGQYQPATAYSEAAIRAAHQSANASAAVLPAFLQALLVERQGNPDEAERMLLAVHANAANDTALRWDIENALANLYAAGHQPEPAQIWYRRSIDTFEGQRDAVRDEALKLSFFANGDTLYRDYADFLVESHRPTEALQLLDRSRARTLQEGLGLTGQEFSRVAPDAGDAQLVSRRINAPILFYALGPQRSYLWAITADRTSLFQLPKQADIEMLVERYQRAILRSSDPLRDANAAAVSLYDALVAPAASLIAPHANVVLIRDGILNGLNFETLLAPGAAGSQYWIETVTVANAGSIRLLSRRGTGLPAASTKSLLLIGDPASSGAEYEKLPNAAAEIDGVKKHFAARERTVVTNAQAVPSSYGANRPDGFSYIHFVAHGTASRLIPLDSAVILSPPPDDPAASKLYARDILKFPLRARLVTISACYGSGLRTYAGEGLVGLAWAFLHAGAHDVIGALWEVNDASTSILMDRLYAEIEQGSASDAALRSAKLSLIHSSGNYRKPLYWGAFQLYAGT